MVVRETLSFRNCSIFVSQSSAPPGHNIGKPLGFSAPGIVDRRSLPKGPSRTRIATKRKFSTGRYVAMAVAEHCGECSEMLVFPRTRERMVKDDGGNKTLQF